MDLGPAALYLPDATNLQVVDMSNGKVLAKLGRLTSKDRLTINFTLTGSPDQPDSSSRTPRDWYDQALDANFNVHPVTQRSLFSQNTPICPNGDGCASLALSGRLSPQMSAAGSCDSSECPKPPEPQPPTPPPEPPKPACSLDECKKQVCGDMLGCCGLCINDKCVKGMFTEDGCVLHIKPDPPKPKPCPSQWPMWVGLAAILALILAAIIGFTIWRHSRPQPKPPQKPRINAARMGLLDRFSRAQDDAARADL